MSIAFAKKAEKNKRRRDHPAAVIRLCLKAIAPKRPALPDEDQAGSGRNASECVSFALNSPFRSFCYFLRFKDKTIATIDKAMLIATRI